ncbi:ATP/GTP-binding protein [Rhodococcus sp. NPDC019627]|uniref:ATP/GTP-binding protein n=1 Tax=unclassified Rhodococcus (in: high G+C Gram-positive bacteria) TaxID=192944 RepID=UPI0033C03FE1
MQWKTVDAVTDDDPENIIGKWEFAELEALAEAIDNGAASAPFPLSPKARALKKWRKVNEERDDADEQTPDPSWRRAFRALPRRGFRDSYIHSDGGGAMETVLAPVEYQVSTMHACGLNPWMIGATAPTLGTPIGMHQITGDSASCDVLTWFAEGLITNPSAFVLSLPGLGKSSFIRKMFHGAVARNQCPIVAGDMKGEYVGATQAMGGQVITLGHGKGHLNPLSAGAMGAVLPRLEQHLTRLRIAEQSAAATGQPLSAIDPFTGRERVSAEHIESLIEETKLVVHSRQLQMITALIELIRQESIKDFESSLLSRALRELRDGGEFSFVDPPLVKDLSKAIIAGSPRLRKVVFAQSEQHYIEIITRLVQSLEALLDGPLGDIFADHTSVRLDLDSTAICIDVSAISRGDKKLKAAVMLSCWSDAYGSMEAAHLLADAGLEPQKYFLAILDELWQVLGAGAGMVNRIDELTRLNRSDGTGLLQITHTGRDLETLPTEVDVKIAKGFIERSGMVICGGLPSGELDRLSDVLEFTTAERSMITSWSRGAPMRRTRRGPRRNPPGLGKFMIKISKDNVPGIPVQTVFTQTEIELKLHDTNSRFTELFELEGVA